MAPDRRIAHRQEDRAGTRGARFDRGAGDRRHLESGGQADLERLRIPLHDRQVDDRHHPQVGLSNRHQRLHVGERPRGHRDGRPRGLADRPGHLRAAARLHRHLQGRSTAGGLPPRDESRLDLHVGRIARQVERRADAAGRRNGKRERRASGRRGDRRGPLGRDGERRRSREYGHVRVVLEQQRQRPRVGPRVHQRRAAGERHLHLAAQKHLTLEAQRAARDGRPPRGRARSARPTTAGTGGGAGVVSGCAARSTRRLYSPMGSVTVPCGPCGSVRAPAPAQPAQR